MTAPPRLDNPSDVVGETSADISEPPKGLGEDVRRIGRYHVLAKIGEGGMGVVYAAFDEQLDRRIAIKVLTAEHASVRSRARIMREAQAMAKLSHPNVVHVYETGEVGSHIYVAMEFVRGRTFGDWLAAAPRTLLERLEVVMQAGEGLVAAHAAGIIHRDFKPDNVMVGDDGRVRVLDFGLARAHEDVEGKLGDTVETQMPQRAGNVLSDQLTQYGAIMGTPNYMSPEQHYGLPTDVASDQFNFCVVLYEALYGERPFSGDSRVALAYATRQGQIRPAPAEARVPPKWREVLLRGLASEPGGRWPSMRALLDELRRVASPARKRPAVLVGGISAAVALAATGVAAVLVLGAPSAEELTQVQVLEGAARLAASRAHWVYPAEERPEDTALRHVTSLRELDGDLDDQGEARADDLSDEFAGTLVRLGDQYWDAEGGRLFARDFYAQALMFDATLELARERSGFLSAELADLRERAKTGDFSREELAAAEELAELATPMLEAGAPTADSTAIAERVASVARKARKRRAGQSHSRPPADPAEPTRPVDAPDPAAGPVDPIASGDPAAPVDEAGEEVPTEAGAELDPAQAEAAAKALVAEALRLKRQGKREAALKKLFQATKVDRRHAPAWDALRDLHFQVGAYQEAAGYGEKAVKYASRNGRYHLRLGEAYWKLKDYEHAEASWKIAQSLGVDQATARLQELREKLGR
jgi:tRNA A-37 threonylcarbamoyl transferase component Bud32/tetratricopeptide (TPR) repeat protein